MKISVTKTKCVTFGNKGIADLGSIYIDDEQIEHVNDFKYLGSTIDCNNNLDGEISKRISKAAAVFQQLSKELWK